METGIQWNNILMVVYVMNDEYDDEIRCSQSVFVDKVLVKWR